MIGFLALARETFDIEYAFKKYKKFELFIDSLDSNLAKFSKLITNDKNGNEAINYFKKLNCKKFVIVQTTFTDAKFITKFAETFNKPIHLISFTEPRTGKRLRLNSLCGVNLAIHSLMKFKHSPNFSIFINNKTHDTNEFKDFILNNKKNKNSNILKKIKKIKNFNKKIILKKRTLGLIGKRPEGFYTCDYNNLELIQKLNYSLKKIKLDLLFSVSKQTKLKDILFTKNQIKKNLKSLSKINNEELNKSISIFHGLKKIKDQKKINTFAIKCWPEMFTEFGCAACGPMAMMNEKGISCACEADVLGSVSCDILNQFTNQPSLLVDVVDCDPDTDTLVFWHCGLGPISMAEKNKAAATIHSNRKKPLLHDFAFKPGKITIFRVSKSENKLKFFLIKGKVLNRKNSFSGTSGVITLGKNTYKKIKNIFLSGLEHHFAFTYGDVFEDIKSLGKKLNIPTYTI